ncbi:putative preprotein translocase subunit SecA [Spironucleus salmonicida]|uniref:Preprotein translocase subunit SecA n=1 Tax=Spironucleus salmonicida TaxID=348837 RepID=A0A9P8RXV5_9EUKA|nr:putative preprotein translocase subunit SecA [Spironucleus salmonicida]
MRKISLKSNKSFKITRSTSYSKSANLLPPISTPRIMLKQLSCKDVKQKELFRESIDSKTLELSTTDDGYDDMYLDSCLLENVDQVELDDEFIE